MIYLTLYALFMLNEDRRPDVSRYQVEPVSAALRVAELGDAPNAVYRHETRKPGCAVDREGKGHRVIECAGPTPQAPYRLFVYPGYRHALPVNKTRSRLPRTPEPRDIRSVGPKFLQDPEDELDLRFPGR
jgi:hypothetical protein